MKHVYAALYDDACNIQLENVITRFLPGHYLTETLVTKCGYVHSVNDQVAVLRVPLDIENHNSVCPQPFL
jgi:hypothetical protein